MPLNPRVLYGLGLFAGSLILISLAALLLAFPAQCFTLSTLISLTCGAVCFYYAKKVRDGMRR